MSQTKAVLLQKRTAVLHSMKRSERAEVKNQEEFSFQQNQSFPSEPIITADISSSTGQGRKKKNQIMKLAVKRRRRGRADQAAGTSDILLLTSQLHRGRCVLGARSRAAC